MLKETFKVTVKECDFHRSCKIKFADEIFCDDCEVIRWKDLEINEYWHEWSFPKGWIKWRASPDGQVEYFIFQHQEILVQCRHEWLK